MKVTVPVTSICKEEKELYRGERLFVNYGYLDSFDFSYRSVDDVIDHLKKLKKEYKDKYDSLEFRKQHNCGCWNGCDCDPSIVLYGTRDENEVEEKVRLHNARIDDKNQKERDRKQYEALKQKFEKK
jgi:hypothetical protein